MAEDKGDVAFYDRIQDIVNKSVINNGLTIGSQLGLFKAIGQLEQPFTAEQLAQATQCKPKVVRQWLLLMVASKICGTDSEAKTFTLPKDRLPALVSPFSAVQFESGFVTFCGSKVHDLLQVFKLDGPKGISGAGQLMHMWHSGRKQTFEAIVRPIVQQIPGLESKLEKGAKILDAGCGQGALCLTLAKFYPNSEITGIDPDEKSIEIAQNQAKDVKGKLNFLVMDAMKMSKEWTESFDYVISVNAVHHFPDMSKGVSEIHRVVKKGGWMSAIEIHVDADVRRNLEADGSVSYYTFDIVMGNMDHHHGGDSNGQAKEDHHHHGHKDGHHHHGHQAPHKEGHHHGEKDEEGHRHGPTYYQNLLKAFEAGGFSGVKKLEAPRASFLPEAHFFAQK